MDANQLEQGLKQLEAHAKEEYGKSLEQILAGTDSHLGMMRVSRLVGVTMKEPLAIPRAVAVHRRKAGMVARSLKI